MAETENKPETRDEGGPHARAHTSELIERAGWFIRIRWLAVIAVLGGTITGYELGFPVATRYLLAVAVSIALYNVLLWRDWRKLVAGKTASLVYFQVFCAAQIVLDYLALTVTIHLTGGIESPLNVFFIFHIVVASMLLPGRSAYFDALFASVLVGIVAAGEGFGIIGHHPVVLEDGANFYRNAAVAGASYFFLVVTFLISSFIANTIGKSLERKFQDLLELKTSLERANELLRAADREKTDFMNLVTHELRSPLVATRSILQTLADQYAGAVNPQQLDLLRRADVRAEQMVDMVSDLLRLAQTRSGAPQERTDFALGEEVDSVVEFFRPQAVNAGVDLTLFREGPPVIVHAARGDVRYIATNLISNAVKYTPPGGSIIVRVEANGGRAVLTVSDTGIGIPAQDLPRLFTEFFRASNAKKQHVTGTGLGLAIIKKLVEAHGGTIEVRSEFGRGSTFTVTLGSERK
jgi:signal transduction histidine kinase